MTARPPALRLSAAPRAATLAPMDARRLPQPAPVHAPPRTQPEQALPADFGTCSRTRLPSPAASLAPGAPRRLAATAATGRHLRSPPAPSRGPPARYTPLEARLQHMQQDASPQPNLNAASVGKRDDAETARGARPRPRRRPLSPRLKIGAPSRTRTRAQAAGRAQPCAPPSLHIPSGLGRDLADSGFSRDMFGY